MIHPDTELRFVNARIGFGVFATKRIPKGTITWVRDPLDRVLSAEEVTRLDPLYERDIEKYSFIDGTGSFVLCWDIARYVNHSCDAPCLAPGWDLEIAVRDIEVGEELRDDYGTLNPRGPFPCACESPRCRGTVLPTDPQRYADEWDARVRAAFPDLGTVAQPLWPLVTSKSAIAAALRDLSLLPSCRAHFLTPG